MIFVPPPQSPKQHQWKDSVKREQRKRNKRLGVKPGLGKKARNSLSTSQGVSTLKIVIMYSVLGMILNWVFPIVIQNVKPDMLKEDAQYYGTLGAIVITFLFLIVSLLKGLIRRNKARSEGSKTQDMRTQIFGTKNSKK